MRRKPALLITVSAAFLSLILSGPVFGSEEESLAEADRLYDTRDEADHTEKAVDLLKKIAIRDPKNDGALWRLSRVMRWKGDIAPTDKEKLLAYKEAEALARRAIEADPESLGGHLMLGIAYGRIGEAQGVMKSLSLISPIKSEMGIVLSKDPNNDVAHHVLGVLYRKVPALLGGSIKKSVEALLVSVRSNPKSTVHHLELAKTYLEKGNKEQAKVSLETLLGISEPFDRVQAKIDRVEAEKLLSGLSE